MKVAVTKTCLKKFNSCPSERVRPGFLWKVANARRVRIAKERKTRINDEFDKNRIPINEFDEKRSVLGGGSVEAILNSENLAAILDDPLTNSNELRNAALGLTNSNELHDDASVSVGEVIRIRVDFSDIVYCEGAKPKLKLNVASRALYESGSGMRSLIFILVTEASDETLSLDWEVETQSRSPLICDGLSFKPCSIVNANSLVVDTSFVDEIGNNLVESLSSQISISATEPSIVSI